MKTKIISVHGIDEALYGLGKSHGATSDMTFEEFIADKSENSVYVQMLTRAGKNAPMDKGHNKFLESIEVWIDIDCPRMIWQEIDTYRVGVTKQSDSTMHTLLKKDNVDVKLDSEVQIYDPEFQMMPMTAQQGVDYNNGMILLGKMFSTYNELLELMKVSTLPEIYKLQFVKSGLPEVFHNCRILKTNYKQLKNMYEQRKSHRMWQWHEFIRAVMTLPHSEWINPPKKAVQSLTLKNMTLRYLKKNSFDGLFLDGECSCDCENLFACGEMNENCQAGNKKDCTQCKHVKADGSCLDGLAYCMS